MWDAAVRAKVRAEAVHREEAAARRLREVRWDAPVSDASDGVHTCAHQVRPPPAVRRVGRIRRVERWETRFVRDAERSKPARPGAADKSDGCRDAAQSTARVAADSDAELDRDDG